MQIENKEYVNWTQLAAAKGITQSQIVRYKACASLEEIFVKLYKTPSDMPMSYGETISKLLKKNKKAVLKKATELLEIRNQISEKEEVDFGADQIIKELIKASKAALKKPAKKKPIEYKTKDNKVSLIHSLTNKGATKIVIDGATEEEVTKIIQQLINNLKLID